MNIYSVIVAVIICATIIAVIWLISKNPFTIKLIKKEEKDPVQIPMNLEELYGANTVQAAPEKHEHEDIAIKSMDAVIKSANELMGIQTEEDLDNNDR